MGKILIEICLISARGLRVGLGLGSSLLKHQWYAVGWIDPEDKYCTSIDASRSDNPLWKTKFATLIDDSKIQESKSAVHVEVYSREPLFLRKKLHGSATVSLKEFLAKYQKQSGTKSVVEESGSYQLRKTNSSKPQGFIDVSIRISAEREDLGGFTGDFGGVMLSNNSDYTGLGPGYMAGSSQHPFAESLNEFNNPNPFSIPQDNHGSSMPNPPMNKTSPQMQQPYYPQGPQAKNNTNPQMQQPYYPPMNNTNPQMHQPYYPPPMQQQPPPPSNTGYLPSFLSRSENVVNIASSSAGGALGGAGRGYARPGTGFGGLGLGAGAIVGAAAAYYGGEYLSGATDLPTSLSLPSVSLPNVSLPSLSSITIDPPF